MNKLRITVTARRLWRWLLTCLALSAPLACHSAPTIWIALSESGGAHDEVAQTIRASVDKSAQTPVDWVIAPWSVLESRSPDRAAMPKLVVAVGTRAWAGVAERFGGNDTDGNPSENAPALLATLLPRSAYEKSLPRGQPGPRSGNLSAVFLDQPFSRQAKLLRLAFPAARKIGLILGPESRLGLADIRNALTQEAFTAEVDDCPDCSIASKLQSVLERSELVLATPDQQVFNSQTIGGILSAGYRRRIPLVGFSPAYVKAGAAIALYSTPEQQGVVTAEAVLRYLQSGALPPPSASPLFSVGVNADVARAFGFVLDEKSLETQLRKAPR